MKKITRLAAALCATALFTPVARAQTNLYVGSNSSGVTTDFTSGTNAYDNTFVGYDPGADSNTLNVLNTNTLLTNSGGLVVGNSGSGNSLTIADGGTVASGAGDIGFDVAASNNSVLVTGANSLWTNSGDLYVGINGSSNSLTIANGSTVANVFGYIGYFDTSSNNSVVVTGSGSLWTNSGNLYVGFEGSGNSLEISDGASVANDGIGFIGYLDTSSNNSVLVTGTNSLWTSSGDLHVGYIGSGNSLVISNGGLAVVGNDLAVGFNSGSSDNRLLVTGVGSSLVVSNELRVSGDANTGNTMTIAAGGAVSNVTGLIGSFSGDSATNSVLVTGEGSSWTNSSHLYVGEQGHDNSLVISDGGKVAVGNDSYIGNNTNSSNNSVLVTGTNGGGVASALEVSNDLYVGYEGSGNSLVISNGGLAVVGNDLAVGFNPGSSDNRLLVTGVGSSLVVSNELRVSGDANTGNTMTIAAGGAVSNVTGFIGSFSGDSANNSVLVTGVGSSWTNSSHLYVGEQGHDNSLVISNGGKVASDYGYIGSNSLSSNNSVLVTGTDSLWTNSGGLVVGNSGSGNSLTIADGGTVAASNVIIALATGSSGTLNIGRFGTNDLGGRIAAPTIAFGDGTGAINFNQRDATTITAAISGNGTLSQLGAGTTTLSASNTYTGATTVAAGRLVVDGSIASSAVSVQNGGTLGGSGAVGSTTIESGGTISPGNSPGNLTVEGNLGWNGGGNYNWQVLGTTNTAGFAAGTTWDLLTVTGTLDLTALSAGSKFNINLWSLASTGPDIDGDISDFDSATSYEWLAVVASNITGFDASYFEVNHAAANGTAGFANALDPAGNFSVRQDGGNLYVAYEVVPEPSTYALLALAAAGLGARLLRRRRIQGAIGQ